MLLVEVKEHNDWLISRWNLTYGVSWEQLCKAACSLFDDYEKREILVDHQAVKLSSKEELLKIDEAWNLTVRGISRLIGVPIMIIFHNQVRTVEVYAAKASKEFETADYQKFNLSLGQYMDSVELSMKR